jgi:hypothetical protein
MKPSEKLQQIRRKVESTLADNKDLDFLLKEIPMQIEKRTRLGKGVSDTGELIKLNPLSEGYVKQRKKGKLSSLTSPKKSNLTRTGEMLSSIFGIRRGTIFTFFFGGTREDGESNNNVARYAREKGRPFFDLSTSERNGLQRKISKVIKESIKKLFDK